MAGLPEVPTEELLNFQDYPAVHSNLNSGNSGYSDAHIDISLKTELTESTPSIKNEQQTSTQKSFWTLEYYQQFFDVDTQDVFDRILASVIPKRDNSLNTQLKVKPDLYGPFWISVTLIFTIAISGNIANYLQHANVQYHWKYNFHLVSYAATTICFYTTFVPLGLWGLLKWSSDVTDLDGLEERVLPSPLQMICIYGYSLFIYIPVSILWWIQVLWLQWLLVLIAVLLSGSVLILTLLPAFKLSRHNLLLTVSTLTCHLLLAAGFMLYFFHVPNSSIIPAHVTNHTTNHAMSN